MSEHRPSQTPAKGTLPRGGQGVGKGKPKKRKRRRRLLRLSAVLAVFCAAALLTVYLAGKLAGPVLFSGAQDGFRAYFASFSPGSGYPYTVERGALKQMEAIGTGVITLEGDKATTRNVTAKTVFSRQFAYTDPVLLSAFGRALVYDRTGGSFFLQSGTQLLLEKKADANILTAALAKNGNIALVTTAQDAQSCLTVYDGNFKERFTFRCAKERVASVAFTANGKQLALIAIGAQDAQVYSRLMVFRIGEKEPLFEETFQGTLLMKLQYGSRGKLMVFADTFFRVYDKAHKCETELTYPTGSLRLLRVDDSGRSAFSVQQYGDSAAQKLYIYSTQGIKEQEKEYADIVDIACGKSYTAVLEQTKLTVLNTKGIPVKEEPVDEYFSKILLAGKQVYALNPEFIAQFSF